MVSTIPQPGRLHDPVRRFINRDPYLKSSPRGQRACHLKIILTSTGNLKEYILSYPNWLEKE